MKSPALGPRALVLLLFSLLPCPALAQYIYLDSNGDGVHTAADVLHGVGPTVCDIWLDTGHNKDGSPTICTTNPATQLDMFSYGANLQASGGTLSYSSYTNRLTQFGAISPTRSDSIQFSTGDFFAPVFFSLPPGRYLLGTVTIAVVSGSPSIQFVPFLFFPSEYTAFGSSCDQSVDNPNTLIYGYQWFDADGLPYGAGGLPNQSPVFLAPADMTVLAGENAVQTISATDPETQPLTFAKVVGPAFMSVVTTNPGLGTANGEIRLAPFATDVGTTIGTVSVTDGAASAQANVGITVSGAANHSPVLFTIPRLTVVAGGVGRVGLGAGDPDGGTLHFAKTAGPPYVSVRELTSKRGGAAAVLTASPTLCDVGPAVARISATDGVSAIQRDVELRVFPPSAPPDSVPLRFADPGTPGAMGLADLNGDGNLDVVATHEYDPRISVFLGRGDGSLVSPPATYAMTGPAGSLAFGDFNRDGRLDLAVANPGGSTISVLLGVGDGTLLPGTNYESDTGPSGLVAADMNRDGILDLISTSQGAGTVSVLLGNGDGTFSAKHTSPAGQQPTSLTIADFNLDGRLDVAVANAAPGSSGSSVTVLPGLGDGAFGDPLRSPIPIRSFPVSMTAGDWNWDGATDLAISDFYNVTVLVFRGRGDGMFDLSGTLTAPGVIGLPSDLTLGDLNNDGNMDLVVADAGLNRVPVFFGNGTGGFASGGFLSSPESRTRFVSVGDLNSDGRPDIIVTDQGVISVFLNRFVPGTPAAEARAFAQREQRHIRRGSGGRELCIRLEPLHGSYLNDQVDLTSLTLTSQGTGSVSEAHSVLPRSAIVADTDRNGVAELGVYFSRSEVEAMFDQNQADNSASAQLTGALTDGRRFCTSVELNVDGRGHDVAFLPNPLNPQSKLTFSTTRAGAAKAQLFDIQGRLVRTLFEAPLLLGGDHEVTFDGKSPRGAPLSSGVFFYRLISVDGTFAGRVVILK